MDKWQVQRMRFIPDQTRRWGLEGSGNVGVIAQIDAYRFTIRDRRRAVDLRFVY
jgi:hypothetical protein